MVVRIKECREKAGLSQRALAQKIGVTDGNVCMWELGKTAVPSPRIADLCRVLNCMPNDLFDVSAIKER